MNIVLSQWYPVRCCCTPKKIFGFIQIPDDLAMKKSFNLSDQRGVSHPIELKTLDDGCMTITDRGVSHEVKKELAVYSDDRPIEFWRTMVGFIEATGEPVKPAIGF